MKWTDIAPADALDIDCTKRPDLDPPVNEVGEVCPWPWDPQQYVGAPLGQYHCPYCGSMVMAGMPHLDYRDEPEAPQEDGTIEGWPPDGVQPRAEGSDHDD